MLKRIAFVIGLTLLLPSVSSAQIYAGATVGAGGAHVPFGSYVGGFRGELRLFGGYEFTSNIAAEVMTLDLGTPNDNPSTIGAFGVAAVGTWPVQRWRFSGRLGALSMDGRINDSTIKRTAQPMVGVAVGFNVTPGLTIGLETASSRAEFPAPVSDTARVNWTAAVAAYRF